MDDALVEKVARALCTADEQNGAAPWDWYGSDKAREGYFDQARAVLAIPDLRLAGVKEGLEMAAKVADDIADQWRAFYRAGGIALGAETYGEHDCMHACNTAAGISSTIRSLGPRP